MAVDLHLLRVFVAVSRTGNVARAADLLQLTASPVSRSLRELERQTGPLFERAYHDMRLLPRGEELLPAAVDALQLAEDFDDRVAGRPTVLRVAATPWASSRFLDAFSDAIAASDLPAEEFDGSVSADLIAQLRHGEIDLALVHLPVHLQGIRSRGFGTYRFELLAPAGDPLAETVGDGGVEIGAIAGRHVFIFPVSMQPTPSGGLRSWLEGAGAATVEEVSLSEIHTLGIRLRRAKALTVTAAGDDGRVSYRADQLVRIPVKGEQPNFQLGLAWREVNPLRRAAIRTVEEGLAMRLTSGGAEAPLISG